MLGALKKLFSEIVGADEPPPQGDERRLAAAALLVHVASVDGVIGESENARLLDLLQARFGLNAANARALAKAATQRDREAVDLYGFTRVLKQKLDEAERRDMIDMMWSLAYADGVAHEFEENVIWRAAELLGVSPRDRIASRQRAAREHLGEGE